MNISPFLVSTYHKTEFQAPRNETTDFLRNWMTTGLVLFFCFLIDIKNILSVLIVLNYFDIISNHIKHVVILFQLNKIFYGYRDEHWSIFYQWIYHILVLVDIINLSQISGYRKSLESIQKLIFLYDKSSNNIRRKISLLSHYRSHKFSKKASFEHDLDLPVAWQNLQSFTKIEDDKVIA